MQPYQNGPLWESRLAVIKEAVLLVKEWSYAICDTPECTRLNPVKGNNTDTNCDTSP